MSRRAPRPAALSSRTAPPRSTPGAADARPAGRLRGDEKFLLVPVNGMGDTLMFLPLAWKLKQHSARIVVHMLVQGRNSAADAARLCPWVDAVFPCFVPEKDRSRQDDYFAKMQAFLRRENYDYVATLVPNTLRRRVLQMFQPDRWLVEHNRGKNEYAAALGLLQGFAGLPSGNGYGTLLRVARARRVRRQFALGPGHYVLFCLEGKSPARCYTNQTELLAAAGLLGCEIVLAGGSGSGSIPAGVRDLRGMTTVAELVALIEGARAVVAVDGGSYHAAVALAIPIVGLFGSIHSSFRIPPNYPAPIRALDAGLAGTDGYESSQDFFHPQAMVDDIPARVIIAALKEVLGELQWPKTTDRKLT